MLTLGIETSCDETAIALIETRGSGRSLEYRIISSLIHSQSELHSAYGGVFPTLAKREHEKNLPVLLEQTLGPDGVARGVIHDGRTIDRIAVTEGPGLEPALWTGIEFSQKLGERWRIPVIPVDHMEGHIVGSLLQSDRPDETWRKLEELPVPALAFLISGGHTEIVLCRECSSQDSGGSETAHASFAYEVIGSTKDDAVGEAFDKTARLLGLPYPGGPKLSAWAQEARRQDIPAPRPLPRPMIKSGDLDMSFSGLKTAVLYAVRDIEKSGALDDTVRKGLAREFEDAVVETLEVKLRAALDRTAARALIVGGGVAANSALRDRFEAVTREYDIPLFLPSAHVSGDNALMIALAGSFSPASDARPLKAHGTKRLGAV